MDGDVPLRSLDRWRGDDTALVQRRSRRSGTFMHRLAIARCIDEVGSISRVGISRSTGLAPATVNRLVARMEEKGLVVEAGLDAETGGRPSRLVRLNDRHRATLAVDVADRDNRLAWIDLHGRVIESTSTRSSVVTGEGRVDEIVELVRAALERVDMPPLMGIGVAAPGPVDSDGTVVFAPSLRWDRVPLGRILRDETGASVVVENDANLIAIAEYLNEELEGVESLISIAIFDGVGSGIVEGGRLWRGAAGTAGQFGRMLTEVESLGQSYARFGDLEQHLGRIGILERSAREGLVREGPADPFEDLMSRAFSGKAGPAAMMAGLLEEYAFSLVNVCALLAPDVITFSGVLDPWMEQVVVKLRRLIQPHVLQMPSLRRGVTGDMGTLIGAAAAAFAGRGGLARLV